MSRKIPGLGQHNANELVQAVVTTATLAQINAGLTLVPAVASVTLKPVGYLVIPNGSFAALTDIRLSDTADTPVDILTIAQAQAGDGVVHTVGVGTHTRGAGFAVDLTEGKGIQIRKTGSAGTTATDALVIVWFTKSVAGQ
jgi:hypothetical protein